MDYCGYRKESDSLKKGVRTESLIWMGSYKGKPGIGNTFLVLECQAEFQLQYLLSTEIH